MKLMEKILSTKPKTTICKSLQINSSLIPIRENLKASTKQTKHIKIQSDFWIGSRNSVLAAVWSFRKFSSCTAAPVGGTVTAAVAVDSAKKILSDPVFCFCTRLSELCQNASLAVPAASFCTVVHDHLASQWQVIVCSTLRPWGLRESLFAVQSYTYNITSKIMQSTTTTPWNTKVSFGMFCTLASSNCVFAFCQSTCLRTVPIREPMTQMKPSKIMGYM